MNYRKLLAVSNLELQLAIKSYIFYYYYYSHTELVSCTI